MVGRKAFVNYLNSINYGGSTQWRLPTAGSNPGGGYYQTGSELGQLFYSELGGPAGSNILNTTTFNNEQTDTYWSSTEVSYDGAWGFVTKNGIQGMISRGDQNYAWAVSPGHVAAVPVPGAVWLMVSGLLGLVSLNRRGHAGYRSCA